MTQTSRKIPKSLKFFTNKDASEFDLSQQAAARGFIKDACINNIRARTLSDVARALVMPRNRFSRLCVELKILEDVKALLALRKSSKETNYPAPVWPDKCTGCGADGSRVWKKLKDDTWWCFECGQTIKQVMQ